MALCAIAKTQRNLPYALDDALRISLSRKDDPKPETFKEQKISYNTTAYNINIVYNEFIAQFEQKKH